MDRPIPGWMLFGAVVALAGCGGPTGPPLLPLEGTVSIDNVPITAGTINFAPQELQQGASRTAEIVDGKYRAEVPAGKILVLIQATRETDQMANFFGEQRPEYENIVPPEYRDGIAIDVLPGTSLHDFDLRTSSAKEGK